MNEKQTLKFIQDKLNYYYLKAEYSHPTIGHVFITVEFNMWNFEEGQL